MNGVLHGIAFYHARCFSYLKVMNAFPADGYMIEPVYAEAEVNFIVSDAEGYLFRLVPSGNGFTISKLDQCLGIAYDAKLADAISASIFQHEL